MFSKKKETSPIDAQQREMYEHARKRIIQKKRLFQHFVFFVVGSVFMIVLNLVLGLGKNIVFLGLDWFVVVILIWAFLFVMHFCNVWLFSKFMGKEWTDRQMERLIAKQKLEIANIQREVDLMHPKEELLKKKNELESSQLENPNQEL
ncbi:hypothetical protein AB832_01975 [Flavobacteriaceae bacterium (ex Bugula neritina AB1)]|nr:hypothetical protein AB832_01975 [Flavobacteriaceae bacterium (ex Bugula neritina AB1)]